MSYQKILARRIANYYIKIPYGKKCEVCKKKFASERHHSDYYKPLEVILVCKYCHKRETYTKG